LTENYADDFHQKQKEHPSTDPPGGTDHAARRFFVQGKIV
jgi:hypothetical protein